MLHTAAVEKIIRVVNAIDVLERRVKWARYDFNTLMEFPALSHFHGSPIYSCWALVEEEEREKERKETNLEVPENLKLLSESGRNRALRYCEKFENLENGTAISVAVCANRLARGEIERNKRAWLSTFPLFGRISPCCPMSSYVASGFRYFPPLFHSPLPPPPSFCRRILPYSAHCHFNIALYAAASPISRNYFRRAMQ